MFCLTKAEYRVEEGQTLTETVCVKLFQENGDCIVPFSFLVIFNTRDGSGKEWKSFCVDIISTIFVLPITTFLFSAVSPEDYTGLTQVERRVPPCTSQICVPIQTVNDGLIEEDENLYVSLTRGINWDPRIRLTRTVSEVIIEDNDCE